MLAIRSPAGLALDFPVMSEHSTRAPFAIDRAEPAAEVAATIVERRTFNDRMIGKGSMSQAEADRDLAPLVDLALDLTAPVSWPRPDRACSWAAKAEFLRHIITRRRKKLPVLNDTANAAAVVRLEALEALHWKMTIELAWCDAFDRIANHAECVTTIRAWNWAIGEHERRAADAGEAWARLDRSTAGRAAWLAANPGSADRATSLDAAEQAAALELGIAVMEQAA